MKALRKALEGTQGTEVRNDMGTTWLKEIPKKVNIFVWRAKLRRLPTRVVLDEIGVDLDSSLCPRCGTEVESVEHALITCGKVRKIWHLVGRRWRVDLGSKITINEIEEAGFDRRSNGKGSRLWTATIWSFLYFIWSNRNKCVFEKASTEIASLFLEFQLKSFDWVSRRDKNSKIDLSNWLANPSGS